MQITYTIINRIKESGTRGEYKVSIDDLSVDGVIGKLILEEYKDNLSIKINKSTKQIVIDYKKHKDVDFKIPHIRIFCREELNEANRILNEGYYELHSIDKEEIILVLKPLKPLK